MRGIGEFLKRHISDIMALLLIAGLMLCLVIARHIFILMIPWIIG